MACPNEIYFFHNFYNSFQKGSMNFQPTQIFLTYIPNGNLKLRALKRFPAVMTFLLRMDFYPKYLIRQSDISKNYFEEFHSFSALCSLLKFNKNQQLQKST